MNTRPDQLENALTKKTYCAYMVSGDEPLQQMEAMDSIRSFLCEHDYREREILNVEASFDWQQLNVAATTQSLFAQRRIIELRMPTAKPGRQGSQAIKNYLDNPPPDVVLIINAGKVDASSKKTAWYKALEQKGLLVQCWPITLSNLNAWLKQRFSAKNMQVEPAMLDYISSQVEGNLLAANQEIEKLYLLLGPGNVSFDDASQAISSQSRYNAFELSDMMLAGNMSRVVKIIAGLKAESIAPLAINWVLTKDIRLLTNVAEQIGGNLASADYLLKRSGVWQNRMGLFKSCLARHTQQHFYLFLKRCAYLDGASKGLYVTNLWDEIETLCIRVANTTR